MNCYFIFFMMNSTCTRRSRCGEVPWISSISEVVILFGRRGPLDRSNRRELLVCRPSSCCPLPWDGSLPVRSAANSGDNCYRLTLSRARPLLSAVSCGTRCSSWCLLRSKPILCSCGSPALRSTSVPGLVVCEVVYCFGWKAWRRRDAGALPSNGCSRWSTLPVDSSPVQPYLP